MVAAMTLGALLSTCAPSVSADTMRSIVTVESGGDPYAIHDNTSRRAYFPQSRAQAQVVLAELRSHNLDVGISQVNAGWFPTFGVTATQMLEPCRNLRIGSVILARAYRGAASRFPEQREALWHALSAYNTGSLYAGAAYVNEVVAATLSPPIVPSVALLTRASAPEAASTAPVHRRVVPSAATPDVTPLAVYRARHRNERAAPPVTVAAIHRL